MITTNATNTEHRRVLSELEHLLQASGCPACRYVEEAERSFFSWFEIESFSIAEMQARLRAAMGMCPSHLGRLIDQIGEGHIITTAMREALAGARQRLGAETVVGRCPACEATSVATQRAIDLVLDGLGDPRHTRLYAQHAGVCAQHLSQASAAAEPSTLKVLAERLRESLDEADDRQLIELLGGVDRDASRRASWRRQLPADPTTGSTLERLGELLTIEACPLCFSVGWIERRYVEWYLDRNRAHDPAIPASSARST